MYDVRDVLRKAIDITLRKREMFEQLKEDAGDIRIRMQISVFEKTMDTDIHYYETMIKNITDAMAENLDFAVFDKISFLVNQFTRTIVPPKLTDQKSMLRYFLEQEKAAYALLVDIQGRMVTDKRIAESIAYYVLLEAIEDKRKRIADLEHFL